MNLAKYSHPHQTRIIAFRGTNENLAKDGSHPHQTNSLLALAARTPTREREPFVPRFSFILFFVLCSLFGLFYRDITIIRVTSQLSV
jgi:hypothetical protein